MKENTILNYIKDVLENKTKDWLNLTTHRLDIYNEALAKTEFLEQFENLFNNNNSKTKALSQLPTAYDYIRLGHPLSCILEWAIAKLNDLKAENVVSFSSQTMPILAILRKNKFDKKNTQILYSGSLPHFFDVNVLKTIYGYSFHLKQVEDTLDVSTFNGSTIFISNEDKINPTTLNANIDFYITGYATLGSVLLMHGKQNETYVKDIQHVRRRETIAMTPNHALTALNALTNHSIINNSNIQLEAHKAAVLKAIKTITNTTTKPLVASSGLSIQYAILMGLIHHAVENHKEKPIKIVVPPNCYGGTNDQARRVAAALDHVEVVDLPVDGGNDMVKSIDSVLTTIAQQDAIPLIIAEIPTNPRVEVPNLLQLKAVLSQERKTASGSLAVAPIFILDQTFCPNVQFLGKENILSSIKTISFASGSKFPSGGQCTAGYCVGNTKTEDLIEKIEQHLILCDNQATKQQLEILAKQLPSMTQRIKDAYVNTREFVNFIQEALPEAKINFISKTLSTQGFTPSVFSLDLPTKGNTDAEKEEYKRSLNLKLINLMITKIPSDSKYCVSYGQLKGCYWTIPATSTQGTTKEGDKDYIVRASLSPSLDLEKHKEVFKEFVDSI
ncbi:PLP-dependent transferase [Lacinutrix sp.]|uniref:PLP-dependent transferase n=1 Tax=Lacinutrix sp. TaxID=1937692 RepID=UPI00263A1736|nr:PLP-dependent transferase [Lacinutrix sp.]MDG1715341.1 PLP-dependent transferase [Lacinutrix sp.]